MPPSYVHKPPALFSLRDLRNFLLAATSSSWAAHTSQIHRTLLASSLPPFLNTSSLPAPVIKCPGGLLIPSPSALALCSTLLLFHSSFDRNFYDRQSMVRAYVPLAPHWEAKIIIFRIELFCWHEACTNAPALFGIQITKVRCITLRAPREGNRATPLKCCDSV